MVLGRNDKRGWGFRRWGNKRPESVDIGTKFAQAFHLHFDAMLDTFEAKALHKICILSFVVTRVLL